MSRVSSKLMPLSCVFVSRDGPIHQIDHSVHADEAVLLHGCSIPFLGKRHKFVDRGCTASCHIHCSHLNRTRGQRDKQRTAPFQFTSWGQSWGGHLLVF